MEKKEILTHLQQFIKSKKETEMDKNMASTVTALEGVTAEDITIGEEPISMRIFNVILRALVKAVLVERRRKER